MRTYDQDTLDAFERGGIREAGAVWIDAGDDHLRAWTGFGDIELDGEIFTGTGSRGTIRVDAGAIGGAEQGAQLALTGAGVAEIELFKLQAARNAPVVIWELLFAGPKQLLDARVVMRGRLDELELDDTIGGASNLIARVEGAARALGRALGRMRTDADQRLISATDGGFRGVSHAGEVMLSWGGRPPQRVGAFDGFLGRWRSGASRLF